MTTNSGLITLRRALAQSRKYSRAQTRRPHRHSHRDLTKRTLRSDLNHPRPTCPWPGIAEITLIEQTSAFSVFPNDGVRIAPRYIKKVTDYEGRILEEDFPDSKTDQFRARRASDLPCGGKVVLPAQQSPLAKMPYPLAGKTGTTTTSPMPGYWLFAVADCGVWMGYDERSPSDQKNPEATLRCPSGSSS